MFRTLIIATLCLAPSLSTASAAEVTGLWLTEKKGIIVDLYECDGGLCGRTVWLKKMFNKDGSPRLDGNNPDEALHGRHWCGIEVITNVRPDGPSKWDDGEIYDPKTGRTFDIEIKQKGERLKVRGYYGIKIAGKSEIWTRTDAADFTFCTLAE
jgi:uncharacterized protein (DUF2147 family)